MMRSSSMSNHVSKVSQQSSQQQVNCTSRPTHHQKDAYWNQMRSNNLPINVSQSHHVSECNVDRLEQDGPTIINSCKLKMNNIIHEPMCYNQNIFDKITVILTENIYYNNR